MPKIFGGWTL